MSIVLRVRHYVLVWACGALMLTGVVAATPDFAATATAASPTSHVSAAASRASSQSVVIAPNVAGDRTLSGTGVPTFDMIGLQRAGASPVGRFRVHTSSGWGAWQRFEASDGGPDANPTAGHTSEPTWVGDADGYDVDIAAGTDAASVVLVRPGSGPASSAAVSAATLDGSGTESPGAPDVFPRDAWTDRPPATPPEVMSGVKVAFVHHTVNSNTYSADQVPAMLRAIQDYHMDTNGWNDIAYNFLVDRFGRIWEGRGSLTTSILSGATGGFNTNSVSIAVLGDYSSINPSDVVINAVGAIAGWKLGHSGIDPWSQQVLRSAGFSGSPWPNGAAVTFDAISPHDAADYTDCPGHLADYLDAIRAVAAQWAVSGASPFGFVDSIQPRASALEVQGWAIDPDVTTSIQIHTYIDGVGVAIATANVYRPDVAWYHPTYSAHPHGFDFMVPAPTTGGQHQICVYAINVGGPGTNTTLDCTTFQSPRGPFGYVDSAQSSGGTMRVAGWTIDPDTVDPIAVHVYVDGHGVAGWQADLSRPDVAAAFPGYGDRHGYDVSFATTPGSHTVCVYGIDVGPGDNALLACRAV